MKRLYFIRHGESEGNVAGIFSGRMDVELTPKGVQQARIAGIQAKETGLVINLIITSPYKRTRATANSIATEIGYPLNKIKTNELLLERNFGNLEGTSMDDYLNEHLYQEIDNTEKAETLEHLQLRALSLLDHCKMIESDNILLVGHAAFGRALRRVIENKPYTAEYTDPLKQIPNAEIIKLI